MWSIAIYDYGLTAQQFKALTPAQFDSLGKRFDMDRKHQDLGFGTVSMVIANAHRNPETRKKPYTAEDFMPVYEKPKAKPKVTKSGLDLKSYWDLMVVPHAAHVAQQNRKARKRGSQ